MTHPSRLRGPAARAPVICLALAALVATSATAHAGDADDVPVPGHYSSAFGAPPTSTPPTEWRDANEAVGAFPRGHADLLKWEAANPTAPPAQAQSAAAGAVLDLATATRLALGLHPELVAAPGQSEADDAHLRIALLELVREVRKAWADAVTERARARVAETSLSAAEAGAELSARMARVGNISAASHAAEQLLLVQAQADAALARHRALQADEHLARLTGLSGDARAALALPQALPALPAAPLAFEDIEGRILAGNADFARARREAERLAFEAGATQVAALRATRAASGVAWHADALSAPFDAALPRQDPRQPTTHAAERALLALAQRDRLEQRLRSEAREAYHAYRSRHDLARALATTRKPLAVQVEEETLLRYNGMLASTWDALASTRARLASDDAALDALRGYWHAHVDLLAFIAGGAFVAADISAGAPAAGTNPGGH